MFLSNNRMQMRYKLYSKITGLNPTESDTENIGEGLPY